MKYNKVLMVLMIVLLIYSHPTTASDSYILDISEQKYDVLTRDWEPVSLLYDNMFHNYTEMMEELAYMELRVPGLISSEIIGKSYLGKNITALKITNENIYYPKAKTLVVAHHHGREQITIEMALRFILYLLNNYQVDDQITDFVDNLEIYVIPTINPDALDIVVEEENYWLRKNVRPFDDDGDGELDEDPREDTDGDGRVSSFDVYSKLDGDLYYEYSYFEGIDNDEDGLTNEDMIGYVDLNRNYETFWRENRDSWSPDTQHDAFPGEEPFSENETRAFRDFARLHKFAMAYSIHSGINATYFAGFTSGGWFEEGTYWDMVQDYRQILPHSYTDMFYNPNYEYHEKVAAGVSGGWGEWMYMERGTVVPVTLEVYRNGTSVDENAEVAVVDNSTHLILEWDKIYEYFNPSASQINQLWSVIRPAFTYLMEQTPDLEIRMKGEMDESTIDFEFNITNPSDHLSSVEDIHVFVTDTKTSVGMVGKGKVNYLMEQEVEVPSNLALDDTFQIMVGNNYTGGKYYQVERILDTESAPGFLFIGLICPIILISYIYRNTIRK